MCSTKISFVPKNKKYDKVSSTVQEYPSINTSHYLEKQEANNRLFVFYQTSSKFCKINAVFNFAQRLVLLLSSSRLCSTK